MKRRTRFFNVSINKKEVQMLQGNAFINMKATHIKTMNWEGENNFIRYRLSALTQFFFSECLVLLCIQNMCVGQDVRPFVYLFVVIFFLYVSGASGIAFTKWTKDRDKNVESERQSAQKPAMPNKWDEEKKLFRVTNKYRPNLAYLLWAVHMCCTFSWNIHLSQWESNQNPGSNIHTKKPIRTNKKMPLMFDGKQLRRKKTVQWNQKCRERAA